MNAWRRAAKPDLVVNAAAKKKAIAEQLLIEDDIAEFVFALVSLAKNSAIGLFVSAADTSQWWKIVDHHDLTEMLENERDAARAIEVAQKALEYSREISRELIDFDDMIYMPVVSDCRVWKNNWLLVDEAQDINPARRALARKMLLPNGRAMFVGDRHQAIYGFTGADADAIDQISKDFKCQMIPLTTTYRCPKAVVAEARAYVSHIEAAPTAPEGIVREMHQDHFLTMDLRETDAILCRNTKPLVETAFRLIRNGIACHVEGRDIGAGLVNLATRWKKIRTTDKLRDRLEEYAEAECGKLIAKGQETQAEALRDRIETIEVMMAGCETVTELVEKIQKLFKDSEDGHTHSLTLSTVHKSKGREWPRVFILGFAELMPSACARQDWQIQQENNLIYVAFTRAQEELVLVRTTGAVNETEQPAKAEPLSLAS